MKKYKALAFDLDDTLLDTSRYLIPAAAKNACLSMIAEGLHCGLEECLKLREDLAHQLSHFEIFESILNKYGCDNREEALKKALKAFYTPEIPEKMPAMPGALQNLITLQKNYSLFLVTMGNKDTQIKKIKSLQLDTYFEKIFIFDSSLNEKKETAFREIIYDKKIQPKELLSVGNRLSSEIRDGKKVGADTCYFAHGEHVGEIPQLPEDNPDFTVYSHQELIDICAL